MINVQEIGARRGPIEKFVNILKLEKLELNYIYRCTGRCCCFNEIYESLKNVNAPFINNA